MLIPNLHPSLADLQLFHRLCEQLLRRPGASFRDLAPMLGYPPGRLRRVVTALEEQLTAALIDRVSRSGKLALTPEGRRLQQAAGELLSSHSRLRERPDETTAQVTVGLASVLLSHLLPGALEHFLADFPSGRRPPVSFVEEDDYREVLHRLKRGDLDFGMGPFIPEGDPLRFPVPNPREFPEVLATPLGSPFDIVAIYHRDHRLARGATVGQEAGPISLEQLAGEKFFVLGSGIYPGLENLLREVGRPDAEFVPVRGLLPMVGSVCGGSGVGLAPGFYWSLEQLRRYGPIQIAPIRQLRASFQLGLYLRRGGLAQMSNAARALEQALQKYLADAPTQPGWQKNSQPLRWPASPASWHRLRHAYYVSFGRPGHVASQWYHGTIDWEWVELPKAGRGIRRPKKTDELRAVLHDPVIGAYRLRGQFLGPRVLVLHALAEATGGDALVITLNMVGKQGGDFVGSWTGSDQIGQPLSGPFVLSTRNLSLSELQELARCLMLRSLTNANSLGPGFKEASNK